MHNNKINFSLLVSALIMVLWVSACSQIQQEVLLTPTETINIFPAPEILPSATSTVGQPQIIFTKTLTSTPQPKINCPVLNSKTTISGGETVPEIEQAILDYLNQGGLPERLQLEIKKLQDTSIVGPTQVFIVDTNGDGIQEIVLDINFGPPVSGDYLDVHGNLHVYNCADGEYDNTEIISREFADTQKILAVENLLGSDAPEILISRRWTYLDGYDEFIELYSLKEEGWILSFNTYYSPCGIQTDLKDGNNGHKELIVIENTGCSPSVYKPLRGRKQIYEFADNEVKLIHDEWFPSPYRIHVLQDGKIAIGQGNLANAIELYHKAARDNSLIDALTASERDKQLFQNIALEKMQQTAHAYQTSFAYFREFVLLHYTNQPEEAESLFNEIKILFPEGKSGSEFVDISSYFLDQINAGLSVQESCNVTNEYIAEKYRLDINDFIFTHLDHWGYVPSPTGELLCPIINTP